MIEETTLFSSEPDEEFLAAANIAQTQPKVAPDRPDADLARELFQ